MNVFNSMQRYLLLYVVLVNVQRFAESIDRQKDLIQTTATSFHDVQEDVNPKEQSKVKLKAPQHILELYERYRTSTTASRGNTVRSILPMKGKLNGVEMLMFNLTGVQEHEQILQGKLHLFRRNRHRSKKNAYQYRLIIQDLGTITALGEPQVVDMSNRQKPGWHEYDITDSVAKCRSIKKKGDYLIGVTSEARRNNAKFRTILLRRVMRLSSQPFLVIISQDKDAPESSSGRFGNTSMARDIEKLLKTGFFGVEGLFPKNDTEAHALSKRSLESNELEELRNLEQRLNYKRKSDSSNPNPLPSNMKSRKAFTWRKLRKKNNRKLPFEWVKHDVKNEGNRVCRRKKLEVDFSSIGWSDWVISPSTFDAYYCTGRCSFPLIKNGNPSNHATIQSLVHVYGKVSRIPAPCCVPSATSSLTLLYFDENKNVVLKNYPNMIVEHCSCR